jgi:hypothetical protein
LDTNQQVWQVRNKSISTVPELKNITYMNSASETVFINDLGSVYLFRLFDGQRASPRESVPLGDTIVAIPLHNMQQVVVLHNQLVALDLDGNLNTFSKSDWWRDAVNPGKQLSLPFSSGIDRIFTVHAYCFGVITSELDLWYFEALEPHKPTKIDNKDISLDVLCPPRHQKQILSGASVI